MKALTITPGEANSAELREVPEPSHHEGEVLVRALGLGICGTDFELISAEYGWAPAGSQYLVLGHESLGRVQEAPPDSGFNKGDLVVGVVRRPDPVPCLACGAGEWDMCRNGRYTERGIKERHGFASEFWRNESHFTVKLNEKLGHLGVLMEPASILAKAWDQIERIGHRSEWRPQTVLVTGAGPIGLLAALMGAQRGLQVHVLDRVQTGIKPQLVQELGGEYHLGRVRDLRFNPDIVIECTGVAEIIVDSLDKIGGNGIVCLAGVSSHGQKDTIDVGCLNRKLVLENGLCFGTVNANKHHYDMAQKSLLEADQDWLGKLITRRVPVSRWHEVLQRNPDDIKVVLDFTA